MNAKEKERYIEVAFRIGIDLCREAMWHNGKCTWLHAGYADYRNQPEYHPMSYNLYDGTGGVAFFLLNLYVVTKEKIFLRTGLGALQQANFNALNKSNDNNCSFYAGRTGLAYVLLKASEQLGDKKCSNAAQLIFKKALEKPIDEIPYDLMHGLAGMIPAYLLAYTVTKKNDLLAGSIKYGNHLLENAIVGDNTLCWNYKNEFKIPHTGFAHGSSGMAYAFALLYKFSKEDKFKTACFHALNYEDNLYNTQLGNWQNLDEVTYELPENSKEKFQSMWCYGAAGMGLARVAIYKILKESSVKEMALNACDVALNCFDDYQNFSLCHGHFSNGELLLSASKCFKNNSFYDSAIKLADKGIEDFYNKDRTWYCGTKVTYTASSFMTGVAGIGNFYLRITQADTIQSGLMLEELL